MLKREKKSMTKEAINNLGKNIYILWEIICCAFYRMDSGLNDCKQS